MEISEIQKGISEFQNGDLCNSKMGSRISTKWRFRKVKIRLLNFKMKTSEIQKKGFQNFKMETSAIQSGLQNFKIKSSELQKRTSLSWVLFIFNLFTFFNLTTYFKAFNLKRITSVFLSFPYPMLITCSNMGGFLIF